MRLMGNSAPKCMTLFLTTPGLLRPAKRGGSGTRTSMAVVGSPSMRNCKGWESVTKCVWP